MKTLMMTTAAALMMSGAALAMDMDWDTNADGNIDDREFSAGFGDDEFDALDTDRDGVLSSDEYRSGVFGRYDSDGDGMWSQTEAGIWEDDALTSGREKDGN